MTEWQPSFPDLRILDSIGLQVVAAATEDERAETGHSRRWIKRPLRPLLFAGLLLVLVAATAAAATLVVLRGSVIPAPAPIDVPPEQTPVPDSINLAEPRASDPVDAPPWALRIAKSRTGFICSTAGQIVDGEFGLVGLDGKFRRLAVGIVDGCGQTRANAASLIGARVFDADRARDVRTIVNGIGGPKLKSVTVEAGGQPHRLKIGAGGVFIAAFAGYPEDLAIQVSLKFADGHVESHPFGASRFVTPDPAGGRAWKLEVGGMGLPTTAACQKAMRNGKRCPPDTRPMQLCVRFGQAREQINRPMSSQVCGYLRFRQTRHGPRQDLGYFFGVRREVPGRRPARNDRPGSLWRQHPPRTAVYGIAGSDVERIEVDGPGGTRQAPVGVNQGFLVVYGPKVRPDQLVVKVFLRDGRVITHRGDTNLTPLREAR